MRLPYDATLIVIDVQTAIDDPRWGRRNNENAEAEIARLLAAWRAEGMPIVHVRHDSVEADSPYRPDRATHAFKKQTAPLANESVVGKRTPSAFVDTELEARLDALGATTLVLCGALTANSVEATARHAGCLGYRVFVVADACWTVDKRDLFGRLWPAEDVHALSLAHLQGEYAQVVSSAQSLEAAALAGARKRAKDAEGASQAPG